jgi:hypothetical protein
MTYLGVVGKNGTMQLIEHGYGRCNAMPLILETAPVSRRANVVDVILRELERIIHMIC